MLHRRQGKWPFPLNLFRHRLAQRLRDFKIHHEIIDGLLGHVESHAASYGDRSFRSWGHDAAELRPVLEKVFALLKFRPIESWQEAPPPLKALHYDGPLSPQLFGAQLREDTRGKTLVNAVRNAQQQIKIFLNGRTFDQLTPDELYELSKEMLLNAHDLPCATGRIKYEHLCRCIRRHELKIGKRVRVTRRFYRMADESSPFSPSSIRAHTILESIEPELARLRVATVNRKVARSDAAVIAAVLLCADHRIADAKLLRDVARMENIHLVLSGGIPYLEHLEKNQEPGPVAAVRRIPLSEPVAKRLSRACGRALEQRDLTRSVPTILNSLSERLPARGYR